MYAVVRRVTATCRFTLAPTSHSRIDFSAKDACQRALSPKRKQTNDAIHFSKFAFFLLLVRLLHEPSALCNVSTVKTSVDEKCDRRQCNELPKQFVGTRIPNHGDGVCRIRGSTMPLDNPIAEYFSGRQHFLPKRNKTACRSLSRPIRLGFVCGVSCAEAKLIL